MPENADRQSESAGCLVLVVDQSRASEARLAEGTKSKSAAVATAVNRLLDRLTAGVPLDVALLGYRARSDGSTVIGTCWSGPLEGRQFVSTAELAAAPVAVEQRARKVPGPGGTLTQQMVPFPVWYAPVLGNAAPKTEAMAAGRDLLAAWLAARTNPIGVPPLVLSILGDVAPGESIAAAVAPLFQLQTPAGPPLVFHAHLAGPVRGMPTLYPSTDTHLPGGPVADLFAASSVMPELLAAALRDAQVPIIRGARGLIYNAGMGDLIRLLWLAETYAAYQPPQSAAAPAEPTPTPAAPQPAVPPAEEAPPAQPQEEPTSPEVPASPSDASPAPSPEANAPPPAPAPAPTTTRETLLLVLLLDRSTTPSADGSSGVWSRIQRHANDILGQIARRGDGSIETALVTYGNDRGGADDVQIGFAGTLAGPNFVADTELTAGALRVEESTEQVSNGIGGLISVTRRRPIFVDLEPAGPASPRAALEAVAALVADWYAENPEATVGPIVLHATRGDCDPDELTAAAATLVPSGPGPVATLYHMVVTESPHRVVAYPSDPTGIESPTLQRMFDLSSPLLGGDQLTAHRPSLTPNSRGLVINGGFDLLLPSLNAVREPK